MKRRKAGEVILSLVIAGLLTALAATQARAVPSFARQTGQDCYRCHTMFPELTPTGRVFKMTGYVINKTMSKYPSSPPLAGMAQISYSHTNASQPPGTLPPDIWSLHSLSSGNDIVGSPQQLSVFYAGQIYDKFGAFIQATYANDANNMAMDTVDVRYANSITLCDSDLVFGATLNNNPTVEDVWNSTPAFSFPYATPNLAPTPAAATLIDNTLAAQVGGAGLYGYWNNLIYAAVTVYRTAENGITFPFGAGNHPLGVQVDGALPYWRIAFTRQYGAHSFELGTYGLVGDTFVGAVRGGPTDHLTDFAFDAQYQYLRDKHSFSVQSTWIHENQDLAGGSFATGIAANPSDWLNTFRINGNYYYRSESCGTFGGSFGFFSTTGRTDLGLYAPAPVTGSLSGSPDSNGVILELDYFAPWKCIFTKLSAQYIIYNKFNGAGTNYDGFGTNASDNNTLYVLLWTAF
ncbi:MAG: cytochrome C [Syntrophobacteraceae bacterium]